MIFYKWKRPELPHDHTGVGVIVGWGLPCVGLAILLVYFALDGDAPPFVAQLGSSLISLGIMVLIVTMLLREIRLMAFEAALRAGEVEVLTAPKDAP